VEKKMTIDDLKHHFRHQLTATEEYTPPTQLEYMIIDGQTKLTKRVDADKLDSLIPMLDNFIFEGYKDRMPYFVKPEVIM
jgi:hypothetical protein